MELHSQIRSIDKRLIDDLFGMGSGYVLDFSDKTFAEFFNEELSVNIDDPRYDVEGTSKAKRLGATRPSIKKPAPASSAATKIDSSVTNALKSKLVTVSKLDP